MDLIVFKSPEGFFLGVEDKYGRKQTLAKFVHEDAVILFDQIMSKDKSPEVNTVCQAG